MKRGLFIIIGASVIATSCSDDMSHEERYGDVQLPVKEVMVDSNPGVDMHLKDVNYSGDGVDLVDGSWHLVFMDEDGGVAFSETVSEENYNESDQSYIIDNVPFGFYDLMLTNYAYGGDTIGELLPEKIVEDIDGQVDMQYAGASSLVVNDSENPNTLADDELVATPQLAQVEVTYEGFTVTKLNLYGVADVNLEQGKFYYLLPGDNIPVYFEGTYGGQLFAMLAPVSFEKQKKYTLNFIASGDGDGLIVDMSVSEEMEEGWGGPLDILPN